MIYYSLHDNQTGRLMHSGRNSHSLDELKTSMMSYAGSPDWTDEDWAQAKSMSVEELANGIDITILETNAPFGDDQDVA